MGTDPSLLFISEDLYLYRYVFLKLSALIHRGPELSRELGTDPLLRVLEEVRSSGLVHQISAFVWVGDAAPIQIHVGDKPSFAGESDLLRADWIGKDVTVSVFADTSGPRRPEDELLIGFVSQQIGYLAEQNRLRLENSALRDELNSMEDTLALRKLLDRAKSLLATRHGVTPAAADRLLVQASEENQKPILDVARQIVDVLGNPLLRPPAPRPRRHGNSAAA